MTPIDLLEQLTAAGPNGQTAEPNANAAHSTGRAEETALLQALPEELPDEKTAQGSGTQAQVASEERSEDCRPEDPDASGSPDPVCVEPVTENRSWRVRWRLSWRRIIVLAAVVLGIRTFIGEASVVPTASMEGTILVGDHLFMDKLLYGPEIPLLHWRLPMLKTIRRGDIVVFRYPKNPSETYLKRVAAVAGDRVEIRDGLLYINSAPVPEPYAVHHAPLHNPLESWGPTVVPPDSLFVMGDNRDNSSDSRDWGFVPVRNVIGEPLFVYWSYDAPTARWLDENPAHRFSFYASIVENFFSRTRWKRTGMLL